jgi:multicomponent Na+:H+ antiporter subunit D
VSKWYLLSAAIDYGGYGPLLAAVIVATSLMALAYIWRVVEAAYFGEPTKGSERSGEAPLALVVGAWAVALANIWFGLSPDLPVALATKGAGILTGYSP